MYNRYNDFKNDELSKCSCTPPYSSTLTISSRCDLNDINGKYPDDDLGYGCFGATDAKVSIINSSNNNQYFSRKNINVKRKFSCY